MVRQFTWTERGTVDAVPMEAGEVVGEPAGARPVLVGAVAVALAHALNDTYSSFLSPLLPRIMGKLGLNIALAAVLAMTLSLAASVLQPVMGHLADRKGRRLFVLVGPVLSVVFMSLLGLAPTFWIMLSFLALGGLGSAVFHPPGASLAARVVDGRGSGIRMSLFSFGGTLGYAVGPLLVVALVGWRGLEGMWVAMVPGLLLALLLSPALPRDRPVTVAHALPTPGSVLRLLRGPLGPVFGISVLAAFVQRVFLTMEPITAAAAGKTEATGALVLSVYLVGQAGGSLVGGFLTDHLDRSRLLAGLALVSVPAHVLIFWAAPGSVLSLGAALVAGVVNMAMLPPVVVLAQEVAPGRAALNAGIVMGLAWAVGSVGVLGTGFLGDLLGARSATLVSLPLLLLAVPLARHRTLRIPAR